MDQSLKVTNGKNEPTGSQSSHRKEISFEMQVESVKQENDCLVQSEIHIKTEPQEDENEFAAVPSISYEQYPNYNMKIKTDEPMIKMECENLLDGLTEDPLDVGNEIKVEEQFPIGLSQGKSRIITEQTGREKDKNILETDDDSTVSESNQDQLVIRNNSRHKDKKHICHVCNKTFTQNWILVTHLRLHTGEKPYVCNVCDKKFTRKHDADRHMIIHTDVKPHVCDICRKVFNRKGTLDSHKLIHSNIKNFSCSDCAKSFNKKANLIIHKRVHTGEKPYTCDLCNKAFTQKPQLNIHRRLHTGEKPYSCDICKKSFTRKEHLNSHKRTHKH